MKSIHEQVMLFLFGGYNFDILKKVFARDFNYNSNIQIQIR